MWDFDARPLTATDLDNESTRQVGTIGFSGRPLRKTPAFLDAHHFGTVPAAFSPDGATGIFESNSIARGVARLAPASALLYGADPYEASRIDGFLDVSLVFGRDVQPYLLDLRSESLTLENHARATAAMATYLAGIERALAPARACLVGATLSLADICFACDLGMFWYERPCRARLETQALAPVLPVDFAIRYPRAAGHFTALRAHPAFAPDLGAHLERLERDATP